MDFDKMTKAQIGAYAAERRINLNEREMTKTQMIAALEEALAAKGAAIAEAAQAVADEIAPGTITITHSDASPVRVAVNGRWLMFPVGKPITVPAFVLPVLDAAGIGYSKG
jgi:hypothetical protein